MESMDVPSWAEDRDDVSYLTFFETVEDPFDEDHVNHVGIRIDHFRPEDVTVLSQTALGKVLPYDILEAENLEVLEVWDQTSIRLKRLPEDIDRLKNLKKLIIPFGNLERLPDAICNLEHLEELILTRNPLKELPEDIGNLKNLRVLKVTATDLSSLPESVAELENLEEIDVTGCKFEVFPQEILHIPNLSRVKIWHNQIRSFPENFKVPPNITNIDISYNNLEDVPSSLFHGDNLLSITIYENYLTEIKPYMVNNRIGGLRLEGNNITQYPSLNQIHKNYSLKNLTLSYNPLDEVPPFIQKLKNLESLSIEGFGIDTLPEWLEQMDIENLYHGKGVHSPDKWVPDTLYYEKQYWDTTTKGWRDES